MTKETTDSQRTWADNFITVGAMSVLIGTVLEMGNLYGGLFFHVTGLIILAYGLRNKYFYNQ